MCGAGVTLDGAERFSLNVSPQSAFYTTEKGELDMRVGEGLIVEPGSPNTLKLRPLPRPRAQDVVGLSAAITSTVAVGVAPKGSAVTQGLGKTNPVTVGTRVGKITMNSGVINAGASVVFTVNYGECGPDDVPTVVLCGGGTSGAYLVGTGAVIKGSFDVVVYNLTAGPLNEVLVLNYRVEKGASA